MTEEKNEISVPDPAPKEKPWSKIARWVLSSDIVQNEADRFVDRKVDEVRQLADKFTADKVEEIKAQADVMMSEIEKRIDSKINEFEVKLDERIQKEFMWRLRGLILTLSATAGIAAITILYLVIKKHLGG